MSAIHRFSNRVIDYAERLSDMADAAEGRGRRNDGKLARWLVLPAVGAAGYAIARSDRFSKQAKSVVDGAKTLATELPDDLMGRVQETAASGSGGNASRTSSSSTRRTSRTPRRKSSSTRKSTAKSGSR